MVPVGLSDHREGLYPLEPFNREDAREVIACIEKWQKKLYEEYGTHFIHASDEWYLLAGYEMPEEERYDGLSSAGKWRWYDPASDGGVS